jgi:integrase
VTSPGRGAPQRRCLRLEQWPDADRHGWLAVTDAGGMLLDHGPGAVLRPVTLKRHAASYGRWLGFLERSGWLDRAAGPGDRASPDRIRAYIVELQSLNAPGSVLVRLQSMAVVLGWLEPDRDWTWLRPIIARLRARSRPVRDKDARLRSSEELLALGHRLMAEGEQGRPCQDRGRRYPQGVKCALRYWDGLMIAFLAHHPLRVGNLSGLRLGRGLRREGVDWWLEIEPADSKNRRPYLVPLAQDLRLPLERYLRYWRVQLAGPAAAIGSTALWLSAEGSPFGVNHIGYRIRKHTAAAFGRPVNPHLFRDALATTVAMHRPGLIGIVTPLLGHASIATAQKHYNRAGITSAALAWHDVLDQLSRE